MSEPCDFVRPVQGRQMLVSRWRNVGVLEDCWTAATARTRRSLDSLSLQIGWADDFDPPFDASGQPLVDGQQRAL